MGTNNISDSIDLIKIFDNLKKNWLIFSIFLFMTLTYAVYKNKTAIRIYKVGTYIMLQDEEGSSYMDPSQLFPGFGMFNRDKIFENEILIIKSTPVVRNAIKNLDFRVSYFEKKRFEKNEFYKNSPFIVSFDENHPQPVNLKMNIKFSENSSIHITAEGEEVPIYSYIDDKVLYTVEKIKIDKEYSIGELIENEYYKFKIINNMDAPELIGRELYFNFNKKIFFYVSFKTKEVNFLIIPC